MDEALARYAQALEDSGHALGASGHRSEDARLRAAWHGRCRALAGEALETLERATVEIAGTTRDDTHTGRVRAAAKAALRVQIFALARRIGGRRPSRWRASRAWSHAADALGEAWVEHHGGTERWERTLTSWTGVLSPQRASVPLGQAARVVAVGTPKLWAQIAGGGARWVGTEALRTLTEPVLSTGSRAEWAGALARDAHARLGSAGRPDAHDTERALVHWPFGESVPPLVAATLDRTAPPLEGDGEWGRALRLERAVRGLRGAIAREGPARLAARVRREGAGESARIARLVTQAAYAWRAALHTFGRGCIADIETMRARWGAHPDLPGDGHTGIPHLSATWQGQVGWRVGYTGPEAVIAAVSKWWVGDEGARA